MKRLEFIANLLNGYDVVADIGTDHGLVLKYAFDLGYIKRAIAADINPEPLAQAQRNLKDYPVEFILSDGFKNINQRFDAAVICGMGTHLITEILKEAPKDEETTYILGTHDKVERLRTNLMDLGFKIIDEYLVFDGFYYQFLIVKRGSMQLSEKDTYLGPILKTKSISKDFYQHQIKLLNDLSDQVPPLIKKKHQQLIKWYSSK
jgi:tRNA (adenine22-N1)-methyltransferase